MKERDHFLSKNMVNAPECGKLHLHLSKCSGGEPPDPPPKYVPPTLKMLLTPLLNSVYRITNGEQKLEQVKIYCYLGLII